MPDQEQGVGGTGGVTAPQHVAASYGTYNPPVAVPVVGSKGSPAPSSTPNAGTATVIAMPPPPPAAGSQQTELPPAVASAATPAAPRPVPASTPAPENQADGGID